MHQALFDRNALMGRVRRPALRHSAALLASACLLAPPGTCAASTMDPVRLAGQLEGAHMSPSSCAASATKTTEMPVTLVKSDKLAAADTGYAANTAALPVPLIEHSSTCVSPTADEANRAELPLTATEYSSTCASSTAHEANTSETDLPVTLIEGGPFSAHAEPRAFHVLAIEKEFQALYKRIQVGRIPPKQPPSVDFKQHLVLVALMGSKTSTGYSIRFKDTATITNGELRIAVVEQQPSPGRLVGMAMTSPYAIAKVAHERYDQVVFVDTAGEVLARVNVASRNTQ